MNVGKTKSNLSVERTIKMAQASWIVPVVAIFVPSFLGKGSQTMQIASDGVMFLMCLAGLLLGVFSVSKVRTCGAKKILLPSVVGIIISGLIILIGVANIISAMQQ